MRIIFIALLAIVTTGCSKHNIKNFNLYTPTVMQKADPFPTQEELRERARIVVITDDQSEVSVPNFNHRQVASSYLENLLSKIKNVQLLDRGVVKNIREELVLSELTTSTTPSSEQDTAINKNADYVFLLRINNLSFASEYDNRTGAKFAYQALTTSAMIGAMVATKGRGMYINHGGGNPISGKYYYTADFDGVIKIIKIPSGEEVGNIPLIAQVEQSEHDNSQGTREAKKSDAIMLKRAITEAIENSSEQILASVPVVAHVIARSDHKIEEPALFKISTGSADNVMPGDTVILEKKNYEINPLTQQQEFSTESIPLGTVIENGYGANFCWVQAEDKALASTVKSGDKLTISAKLPD